VSLACLYYRIIYHNADTPTGLAITALVITSGVVAVLLMNTLLAVVQGRTFVPDEKFSPIGYFRIQHAALRNAAKEILTYSKNMSDDASYRELRRVFYDFQLTLKSDIECTQRILFPVINEYFPNSTSAIVVRQTQIDLATTQMTTNFRNLNRYTQGTPEWNQGASTIASDLEIYTQTVTDSLFDIDYEVIPVSRKYFTVETMKSVVRRSIDLIPVSAWARILPFVLEHLQHDIRRLRFLQALRWASPDKIQLLGKVAYENIDEFTYERLVVDVPELAPRSTHGHSTIY